MLSTTSNTRTRYPIRNLSMTYILTCLADIKIGSRCRLSDSRRGTIAFVGPIPPLPGPSGAPWIGIALDEPTGKNDGSVKEERYFQCEKNRGLFVRAEKVEVGDFAKLGLDDELGSDMEEI